MANPNYTAINLSTLRQGSIELQGNCSGVYLLFDGEELVYVGRGWNCLLRVAEHTRKDSNKSFTSWNYIPVENEQEYRALERTLIHKYKPRFNKTFVGGAV